MNTAPSIYLPELEHLLPTETMILVTDIEFSFAQVNYISHCDDLDSLILSHPDLTNKDLADRTLSLYREHVDNVLTLQGIFIAHPLIENLNTVVQILKSTTLMAVLPLHDILEDDQIEWTESNEVYFATLVNKITGLETSTVLMALETVSSDLIQYLVNDLPALALETEVEQRAAKRFKSSPLEKTGIIVDAIRDLNKFGYSLNTFLNSHSFTLSELTTAVNTTDVNDIISILGNEIILMVLGSAVPDAHLLASALQVSEHISNDATITLKLNHYITRYLESHHG